MTRILLFLLVFAAGNLYAQDPWKDVYKESAWVDRDRWQKADELIHYLNLKTGSQVGDVGCHEGYMSVKLAATVGSTGKVYAVDVVQSKLDKLQINLTKRNLNQVQLIKGDYDNPKLPLNTLDAVIILDTYHEMNDHDEILQHIKASLKSGGRLVLCEAIADERRSSTRSEQERKHELGMNFALDDLKKAGFVIIKQQEPFVDRTQEKGDKMWLIVASTRIMH
ncbi:MAG: class I SAM-dependent methyltransferase [Flammeovirgaceae bacterium]|jgi:precorrin-6B methylase 2|nr:class I SAM-dependent methyltransferase [Flammeovirgaceae bacterium]